MAGWKIPGFAARPRFTSRATVLVLVLCSLVAILAYPTRQFISQRSEISAQRARAEHARQQVEQLRREKARWQDPEFVKAQARARLHYAMPGETPFISVDPAAGATKSSSSTGAAGPAKAAKPWYASVWDSVDAADTAALAPPAAPAAAPAPAPARDSSPHDH
ncbi:septum formation initiator family protein [Kitasatospora herbaricolor]|uniref:Septum formation initiator family protein n=1 Tax=Kitasatospora herbaricolor TaxID=68217 RepID=A0ABZ1W8F1_9ACTN|nr:septum formation initiator family protein [Kitasatospora herbaricolor]